MICYRDMTFCDYWGECAKGDDCRRALKPEVESAAEKLGLPVCKFVGAPECFEEEPAR